MEAAQALAARIKHDSSIEASLQKAFLLALARQPKPDELSGLTSFYNKQIALFQSGENKASGLSAEQAALGQTCRIILNLHECITRY